MPLTKQIAAGKIAAYLRHEITLVELVDWAESSLMEGGFEEADALTLGEVVARIGLADVRAFGLTWEDCEELLKKLGFVPRIEVVAA